MVGDEASQLRSMLEVSYPMENGVSILIIYLLINLFEHLFSVTSVTVSDCTQ